MALIAEQSATQEFRIIGSGTHLARCVRVIDLGTQHSDFYEKDQHKVMLTFELPNELIEDKEGKQMPMLTSKEYTISLNEKSTLYSHLVSWRGKKFTDEELKAFDVSKVVGAPCMLSITHSENKGKTYANISGIMAVIKGQQHPDQVHPSIVYVIEDGLGGSYNELPEWVQTKIQKAKELSVAQEPAPAENYSQVADQDLPF